MEAQGQRSNLIAQMFDGCTFGDSNGGFKRVFEPRWFEFGRWLKWIFARDKGWIAITFNGGFHLVHAIAVKPAPRMRLKPKRGI